MTSLDRLTTTVVGTDGTPAGWQALSWAADHVAGTQGRLLICRTYGDGEPTVPVTASPSMATLELADPPLARAVRALHGRLGGHRVHVTVRVGDRVQRLTELSTGATLLVVGDAGPHPGRPGFDPLGRLCAQAPCSVVVIRAPSGPGQMSSGPGQMSSGPGQVSSGPGQVSSGSGQVRGRYPGHVVVGVDGSGPARSALEFAFAHAARRRVPLAAVYVCPPGNGPGTPLGDGDGTEADLLDDELAPWCDKYPELTVRRSVRSGHPVPELLQVAAGAALLVVGDRGRGRMARMLLGSVSSAAVTRAGCSVAVAHDPYR